MQCEIIAEEYNFRFHAQVKLYEVGRLQFSGAAAGKIQGRLVGTTSLETKKQLEELWKRAEKWYHGYRGGFMQTVKIIIYPLIK